MKIKARYNFVRILGDLGKGGHVDFCLNGGKAQPFCENSKNLELCSHVWAVCYMAQSINGEKPLIAEPCSRRCPSGPRIAPRPGETLIMGHDTPSGSRGSFCLNMYDPPYCPKFNNGQGDHRCCV